MTMKLFTTFEFHFLSDQDDTVLLFHAMLGGHPVDVELLNNRQHYSPTQETPSSNDSHAPAPLWHESVIINDSDMVVADGKVSKSIFCPGEKEWN